MNPDQLKDGRGARVLSYIRKSSENNEDGEATKQLNSIEYQREFVPVAIEKYELKLIRPPFEDDMTAYEAFVRNGFNAMIEYIRDHEKEIDGIICTEISRLARNFGDGGLLLWYMQKGVIKYIFTPTKVFTNSSSDQMMVAIELAMSKKSSDETGARTKAGMKSKAMRMKHPPRPPILGYRTEGRVGIKKWLIDEKIGSLVKSAFEQFATGKYTFKQIADYAYGIGIKSISKRSHTGKLSANTWRNRLRDEQYIGIFYSGDDRIVGEYEQLIEPVVFYQVQRVMNGNEHPKDHHVDYAYSKMVKCEFCGDTLSGTNKKGITYYRCGKKKSPCKTKKRMSYLLESTLEEYLVKEFDNIEINQEAWEAARDYVVELNQPQKAEQVRQIHVLSGKIQAEQNLQIDFGRKYSAQNLPQKEYDRLMQDSYQKEAIYQSAIEGCKGVVEELDRLMSEFLDDIKYVTKRFRTSLPKNKREMVDIFCENFEWKDGKVRWYWKNPYSILVNRPKNSTVLPIP